MNGTIVKLAFRNLLKNPRRTLITLLGIAFGVTISILFTGLQDATWKETINTAAELGAGHVTVQHVDYMDEPSVANRIAMTSTLKKQLQGDPRIEKVRPRVVSQAMVATAGQSVGAMMVGIRPGTDTPQTLRILRGELSGEPLKAGDGRGVVIGSELAGRLEIKVGQKLVYTLTDIHGEIVSALGRVRGILSTGSKQLDSTLCLVEMSALRKLIGYGPDEVTQLALYLGDYRDSAAVAAQIQAGLSPAGQVQALPWHTIAADLAGLVKTKMASAQIFEVLILFLVAAGIFNTLYVSVMERMREFGILNAIGFSRTQLFSLVVWESIFTAVGGLILALLVTAWPYYYMYTTGIDFSALAAEGKEVTVNGIAMTTTIHVNIYLEKLAGILAVATGATLLSGVYPAFCAGKVSPVESIKLV